MDYELKYVIKVNSYIDKIKVVEKLLEKGDYETALKAIRALIEATGIVILNRKFNVMPEDTGIAGISFALSEKNEETLSEIYKNINGTLSYIYDNKEIDRDDVIDVLLELDRIVSIISTKYKGIFD